MKRCNHIGNHLLRAGLPLLPAELFSTNDAMSQLQPDQKITFVCCVESGPLEVQTVRMIESLRRWGGRLANAPIVAVTPRFGPPLARKTLQTFEKFDVRYLRHSGKTQYSWFHFLNKPLALVAAEEYTNSETLCWLDSDLLILSEPDKLLMNEGEDFLGCHSDKEMGTTGPDDPFEPLWKESCRVVGLELDDLPMVVTEQDQQKIRLYWNGGIFVYRRSTGFAEQYLRTCLRLMDARYASKASGYSVGFNEMSAIGLAMVKSGLAWRSLPYSHDYIMSSLTHNIWYSEDSLKEAKIIHYHDAMWMWFWPTLIECLQATHPDVAEWLAPLGPMKNEAALPWRAMSRSLKYLRGHSRQAYQKSCRAV